MDRPADPVSPRMLLWGVVAPLLVGGFVPALSGLAMVWLLCGLGTLMVTAACAAVRRADPGEDGVVDEAPPTAWWHRPYETPDVAAARVGSWG